MRVVHVEAGRHLYGGARQVLYLMEGLSRMGIENRLVCPEGSAIAGAARGIAEVLPLPMGGDLDARFFFRLVRLLREMRPDILHIHSRRGADVFGGLAGKHLGLPVLLTRRVDNPEPRPWVFFKYRLFHRIVCISEGIRRVLAEEGVPSGKLVTVPSAVDTARYQPVRDKGPLRRRLGLEAGELAVGMIAQFIPRKGHRLLFEALPSILRRVPEARFFLFGQGPLKADLERAIAGRGLQDRVFFPGFRRDLPDLLPGLDLLVHPAAMEGLGVALLEASACGVPAVATRAGGIPEAVEDGVTGYLVPPGDSGALGEAVTALLLDADLRSTMGEAARERMEARFSIPAMVAGNLRVYGVEVRSE